MGTHPIFESDFDCLTVHPLLRRPFLASKPAECRKFIAKRCTRTRRRLLLGRIVKPFDPLTMACVEGGIEAQTHQVMKNMKAILENAGCDFSNVVKTTVLVQNMDDFGKVNGVYAQYF